MSDKYIISYGRFIVRWRWIVAFLCLLLAGLVGAGVTKLGFNTDYRIFFGPDNPQLATQDDLEANYSKVDLVTIGLYSSEKSVFSRQMLGIIKDVTEQAWTFPAVSRVDSLTNFQHTEAEGDDLYVDDLVRDAADLTDADLEKIRAIALNEPSLVNRLVSEDGRTTQIMVTVQPADTQPDTLKKIVAPIRAMAAQIEKDHPDVEVALSGTVVMSLSMSEASEADSETLIPVMFAVIALTLLIFLRSVSGMVISMVVVFSSVLFALGLTGHYGFYLNVASAASPVIIVTIAVADTIHLLATFYVHMRRGMAKKDAVVESLRINFQPVFITSVTTAIGFLSLNFNDSPPFNHLGNISAIGVFAAWFFAITLLPSLLAILPTGPLGETRREHIVLENYVEWVIERRNTILVGMIVSCVAVAAFIPRLEYYDNFISFFSKNVEFRKDSEFMLDNLVGPYTMELSVSSGEEGGIANPDYMKQLQEFTDWLEAQPEVVHVFSIVDVMKRLNKNMHGDDPAWYKLPEERNLAAQYLLLYEMSLPYGLDLNNQIDIGKSATRVTASLGDVNTTDMKALTERTREWFDARQGEGRIMTPGGTSPGIIFAYLTRRTFDSMMVGTGVAFVLISLCLVAALRSFRLGLISIVPNVLPAVAAFGLWAIIDGRLGIFASAVTATALGLIVDCTVHFLSKYRRGSLEKGLGPEDSVRYAFAMVGSPLWISSLVLICGFVTLGFSDYLINAKMGLLTALIIAVALVTDFLLLPTILLFVDKKGSKKDANA
ncbi:efflux RND transporter permease subunit [Emcibacter nanhaiensis]|uniref:RND family transporter n=1 Tax=Emcibacter nanhaiensis TaxID=1505037 RepID=A0A501PHW5_9PROT|nr:efflux RND transporter permease subunit [Emcibacter nanhaiensis]TPD59785.1 RND family transporter [Emcibacter nanhaiensis]